MSTPAAIKGKDIYDYLTNGISFPVPVIDWNDPKWNIPYDPNDPLWKTPERVTPDKLTEGIVNGNGVFDLLMKAVKAHLKDEYKANRITGAEYSKLYTAALEACMSNGVAFLMQSDDAFWKAVMARMQAMSTLVEIELAKLKYAELKMQENNLKADFANKIMQSSNINESTSTEIYQHSQLLPAQVTKINAETVTEVFTGTQMLPTQRNKVLEEILTEQYTRNNVLPSQVSKINAETQIDLYTRSDMLPAQKAKLTAETVTETFQGTQMLPSQRDMVLEQIKTEQFNNTLMLPTQRSLTQEQREATRAQTQDELSSGGTITGLLGKQKELYSQQIISYQKDAETKAARLFLEHYITRFTILDGEGVAPAVTDIAVGNRLNAL